MDEFNMANFYINRTLIVDELPIDGRPKFYMFGINNYTNMYDQAIALAEMMYIENEFPDYEYVEIMSEVDEVIPIIKKNLQPQDIIAFTGGSTMGNLYSKDEEARRKVFSTFTDNLNISFPQSITFENSEQGKIEKKKSQYAYNKNPNLVLVARDSHSFYEMQSTFRNSVIFTPDIALYLNSVRLEDVRTGALLILHGDTKTIVGQSISNVVTEMINPYPLKNDDTVFSKYKKIPPIIRQSAYEEELKTFSQQKIVITDSWHAMIFAVITGTPCLLFGNNYSKGKYAYFDWLEHISWVEYTEEDNYEDIKPVINSLLAEKAHEYNFKRNFQQLHDTIARYIGKNLLSL